MYRSYTAEEDQFIRDHVKDMTYADMAKLLPGRTPAALRVRASQLFRDGQPKQQRRPIPEGGFPNPVSKDKDGNVILENGKPVYLCCCGECGKRVTIYNGQPREFVSGHNRVGGTNSLEARHAVSRARAGINPRTGESSKLLPKECFETEALCTCQAYCGTPLGTSHYLLNGQYVEKKYAHGHNARGRIKSDEERRKISENNAGKPKSLDHRIAHSTTMTGEEPTFSPYFLSKGIHKFLSFRYRWITSVQNSDGSYKPIAHARLVWQDLHGPLPTYMHVHHRNGQTENPEDDNPDNLLAVHWRWNMRFFISMKRGFGTSVLKITEAYEDCAKDFTEEQLFADPPPKELFLSVVKRLLSIILASLGNKDFLHYHAEPSRDKMKQLKCDGLIPVFEPPHDVVSFSPFVPFIKIQYDNAVNRWRLAADARALHSRTVHDWFYPDVPFGYHAHHRSGRADRLCDDHPLNLFAVPVDWNVLYFPDLAVGFDVSELAVTQIYEDLVRTTPSDLMYRRVCEELLKLVNFS